MSTKVIFTIMSLFSTILIIGCVVTFTLTSKTPKQWWNNSFIYQIYPRSFMDSNNDGTGDLPGISSKLDHLKDLNVSAIWISPIYSSPMADFGYDISNFTNVDPIFGTLEDFTNLTTKAKSLGLKVLLDFVPNHSSDQHPWFVSSINKIKPFDDYYIWLDGKLVNGSYQPPNNWLSVFGGSAWEWNPIRQQYYLHQFAKAQPDLNYTNPLVRSEMEKVLTFWLDHGADGFRMDAVNYLLEDPLFQDEPLSSKSSQVPEDDYESLDHVYSKDMEGTFDVLKAWRKIIDSHKKAKEPKLVLTEAYADLESMKRFYEAGSDIPMNFAFIEKLNGNSTTMQFKRAIDAWLGMVPKGQVANWVIGNHDNPRVADRFGPARADFLTMLTAVLPGVGIAYYGDEIGMVGREMTWEETVDPAGCNAGQDRFGLKSRDPERTPFQWSGEKNAGFSGANETWLPVNENFEEVNLEKQKVEVEGESHYKVFKKMVELKRNSVVVTGSVEVILVTEDILGVVRRVDVGNPVVLLANFKNETKVVDARTWMNIPENLSVFEASVGAGIPSGVIMDTTEVYLPAEATVILH
ncbi:alpha-glucosidase-like [Cotesia glomerata]|uniref:alpha-glucosidase-like n=1 Tax=Cotesia glomerata TaxID=32391 RepID=UPI001D02F871|nr:alpha-glucosidase-like [Cotesia glomerata]